MHFFLANFNICLYIPNGCYVRRLAGAVLPYVLAINNEFCVHIWKPSRVRMRGDWNYCCTSCGTATAHTLL